MVCGSCRTAIAATLDLAIIINGRYTYSFSIYYMHAITVQECGASLSPYSSFDTILGCQCLGTRVAPLASARACAAGPKLKPR